MDQLEKLDRLQHFVLPLLQCPICTEGALRIAHDASTISCDACSQVFPMHEGIPLLVANPDPHLGFGPEVITNNQYSQQWLDLIEAAKPGLALDLGSGNNPMFFDHVVKLDYFPAPHVDVVGLAEALPFGDEVFQAVISGAVFEHLQYPYESIDETKRVLGSEGEVYIETAFLQPVHAFPSHYFNMTVMGLEELCSGFEKVVSGVQPHQYPSFTLKWILEAWASHMPEKERKRFMRQRVSSLIEEYASDPFSQAWQGHFDEAAVQQLAAGVFFHGKKL